MRQVVLDTETTGLEAEQGHRIIEIGGVELINRRQTGRHFHKYLNPERAIDPGAQEVHGLSREFLSDKPLFADVVLEFLDFVEGAELVIHNAPFDMNFLDHELARLPKGVAGRARPSLTKICEVTDSLALARHKHPGQKNNLDALCRRYLVDNSSRQLHGALLDAEILADVYLLLTGGQSALFGAVDDDSDSAGSEQASNRWQPPKGLRVIEPNAQELAAHDQFLELLANAGGDVLWLTKGGLAKDGLAKDGHSK